MQRLHRFEDPELDVDPFTFLAFAGLGANLNVRRIDSFLLNEHDE